PDKGQAFTIDGTLPSRLLVGQSPACTFRLTDRSVSRRHASLDIVGACLRVTDLESKNGTFINGVAVFDALLRAGDALRMCSTIFRIELSPMRHAGSVPSVAMFGPLLGASTEMRRLFPLYQRLASSDVPVIIEGETGTGKEVLAQALHEMGPRAEAPFVVFD